MPPVTGTTSPPQTKQIKLARGREVIHPVLTVCGIPIPREKLRITAADIGEILGWETEAEYSARMVKENPGTKPDKWKFESAQAKSLIAKLGLEVITDENGENVVMWDNLGNRKLELPYANKIAQDILSKSWRFNGETIIVGRTGISLSLQKRGVGLIFAAQRWRKNPEIYPAWAEEPWIEAIIVRGIEETEDTIQTLDNTRPRTEADTIYTSEIFAGLPSREKDECSRMLAKATDTLWDRVGAGKIGDQAVMRTNSETAAFRKRHEKLVECVRYIYEQNGGGGEGRKISGPPLHLSPGVSSALLYLMSCSSSDGAAYRAGEPREEKSLDWKHEKKAKEFWRRIGDPAAAEFSALRASLKQLKKIEAGPRHKLAVVALAWAKFVEGGKPSAKDLDLEHHEKIDGNGVTQLVGEFDVGGIDLGLGKPKAEDEEEIPTEQTELEKARIRRETADAAVATLRKNGVEPEPPKPLREEAAEILARRKEQYGKDGKPPVPKLLSKPLHKRDDKPLPTAKELATRVRKIGK